MADEGRGIRDRIRELRRVPARELLENPKNWRRHPKAQQQALRAILAEIGYAGALLARETDEGELMLIDGHLRASTTPDELVPVLVLDVNAAEADKILLTFDPLGSLAEMDRDAFKSLAGMVQTDTDELREFISGMGGLGRDAPQDPIPAPPVNAVTRPGNLWLLGKHRLLCGDSRKPGDVSRLFGSERAVLFQTDPPYVVGYKGTAHIKTRGRPVNVNPNKDWSAVYHEVGDSNEVGRDFYIQFIKAAIEWAITPNAAWYCWLASKRRVMLESAWDEMGAFVHQEIIWFKSRPVLTHSVFMWSHEPCLFGWVKGQEPSLYMWAHETCISGWKRSNKPYTDNDPSGGQLGTVWEVPNAEVETKEHPTAKPNRLFAIPMERHTQLGDLCYEPFSGSGSQLIAAEQMGRRCYAIEIEPAFVDLAIKRWETLTGKRADLLDDDYSFDAGTH